jgi:hypothetical protein
VVSQDAGGLSRGAEKVGKPAAGVPLRAGGERGREFPWAWARSALFEISLANRANWQNSVFCQRVAAPNTVVECRGIHEAVRLCEPAGSSPGCLTSTGVCGDIFGHSPCWFRKVTNASPHAPYKAGCGPELWAVTGDAEDGAADSVVLPGSNLAVTTPNIATDHYKPGIPQGHCQ